MSVVIIGAGHAGTTAAAALRKLDKDIKISLVSEEGSPPYQRPPLSKKTIFSVTQNFDLILGKDFYNKNNIQLNLNSAVEEINPVQSHVKLNSNKEVRFKVTRPSAYGERYKLFVIEKNTFKAEYSLEEYGVNLVKEENKIVVDRLTWNGKAKKSGFETGDYISEFKIENLDRPNKGIVYPIAILFLIIFGYLNYKRKNKSN